MELLLLFPLHRIVKDLFKEGIVDFCSSSPPPDFPLRVANSHLNILFEDIGVQPYPPTKTTVILRGLQSRNSSYGVVQ